MLLWAAYQLDSGAGGSTGNAAWKSGKKGPKLRQARDVLEHLAEADFVGVRAVAPPWCPAQAEALGKGNRSCRTLIGGCASGVGSISASLVTARSAESPALNCAPRARALDVVRSVEEYLYEGAADHLAELERHGPDDDELGYEL